MVTDKDIKAAKARAWKRNLSTYKRLPLDDVQMWGRSRFEVVKPLLVFKKAYVVEKGSLRGDLRAIKKRVIVVLELQPGTEVVRTVVATRILTAGGVVITRKNRARSAKVVAFLTLKGEKYELTDQEWVTSEYAWSWGERKFAYELGKTKVVRDFDDNPACECSRGIHYFDTFQEAKNYAL